MFFSRHIERKCGFQMNRDAANSASGQKKNRWSLGKRIVAGCALLLAVVLLLLGARWIFSASGNKPTPGGEGVMATPPAEGDPSMYTPRQNFAMASGALLQLDGYTSRTTGNVVAALGFINYEQTVSNKRTVNGNDVFSEAISLSSLKKVGEQKYFTGREDVLVRKADSLSAQSVTWSDSAYRLSWEEFYGAYGFDPRALTSFIVNEQTVISEESLDNGEGNYTFRYVLTPESASNYCREVKVMSGASDYPVFSSVVLTLTVDSLWRPLVLERETVYQVNIPVIGKAECHEHLTEVFSDFSKTEEIKNDVGEITDKPEEGKDDTLKEIADALAAQPCYKVNLSGSVNGSLTVFVALDAQKEPIADGITLLAKGDIGAAQLFMAYKDGKLYAKSGNVKLAIQKDSAVEAVKAVFELLGRELPSINTDSLDIDRLKDNLKIEQSETGLTAVYSASGIEATAQLDTTEGFRLVSADAQISSGGVTEKITVRPAETAVFEDTDDCCDFTGAENIIKAWAKAAGAQSTSFEARLTRNGKTYNAQLRLNNKTGELEITSNINGADVRLVYRDELYINIGNIAVKAQKSDISALKELLAPLMPDSDALLTLIPQEYVDFIVNFTPQSVLDAVSSLTWDGSRIKLAARIGSDGLSAEISENELILDGITLAGAQNRVEVRLTGTGDKPCVFDTQGEYADVLEVAQAVRAAYNTFKKDGISLNVRLKVTADGIADFETNGIVTLIRNGSSLDAEVSLIIGGRELKLVYASERFAADYNGIKLTASKEQVLGVLAAAKELTGLDIPLLDGLLPEAPPLPQGLKELLEPVISGSGEVGRHIASLDAAQLLAAVKSLSVQDGKAVLTMDSGALTGVQAGDTAVTLEYGDGLLTRALLENMPVSAQKTITFAAEFAYPEGAEAVLPGDIASYIPYEFLKETVQSWQEALKDKNRLFRVTLNAGDKSLEATVRINAETGEVLLNTEISGIAVKAVYSDGVIYLTSGNIKVKLAAEDIYMLADKLAPILPEGEGELISGDYIDFISSISADSVLEAIDSLTYVNGKAVLKAHIGSDKLTGSLDNKRLTLDGITVAGKTAGITVEIAGISDTPFRTDIVGEYADALEAADALVAAYNTYNKNSFRLQVQLEGMADGVMTVECSGTIELVRRGDGLDAHVYVNINKKPVELTYAQGRFACNYNGLKFSIAKEQLIPILASVSDTMGLDIELLDKLLPVKPEDKIDLSVFKKYAKEYPALEHMKGLDAKALLEAVVSLEAESGRLTLVMDSEKLTGIEKAGESTVYFTYENGLITGVSAQRLRPSQSNTADVAVKITYPELNIALPDLSGYINADSLKKLMGEFAATAELRQYRLTGKLNAKLLLFNENIPFDMRFTVDDKDNVRGWVKFDIPYVLGLTQSNNGTVTELYLENDVVYIKRARKTKKLTWKGWQYSTDYDYIKFVNENFTADPIKYIQFIFNLTDSITDTIRGSVTDAGSRGEFLPEKALKSFYADSEYHFTLDGAYITDDKNFSDIKLDIRPSGGYLDSLKLETKIISIVNIKVEAGLADRGKPVDMSVIPGGLAADGRYRWY